ncbi:MAG: hypothetical protein R2882_12385 [Gemmatimonadales bacterium]
MGHRVVPHPPTLSAGDPMRPTWLFSVLVMPACTSPSVITLYDNANPNDPKTVASSLTLPDNFYGPNCGCGPSRTPNFNLETIRADGPQTCEQYRPIAVRNDGAAVGDFLVEAVDPEGVGCVQVVASPAANARFVNVSANDPGSAVQFEMAPGECAGHQHLSHQGSDFHFRFAFDGTRTRQAPSFTYARYDLGHGQPADPGLSMLRGWIEAEYWDGAGNRTFTDRAYVVGPTGFSCIAR